MQKDGEINKLSFDCGSFFSKESAQDQAWKIVSGNDLGILADALGDELFSVCSLPFEKRIVVVPNTGYKDFLFQRFAVHPRLQMAAGVQVLPLNQAVMEILDSISTPSCGKRIPSFLELTLAIESILHDFVQSKQEDLESASLLAYLGSAEKRGKRISTLSDELARLFERYGLHGKNFLPLWLAGQGWQQSIWMRVFSEDSPWAYPLKFLAEVKPDSFQGKIALFGFSYLSSAHLHFFCSVPATVFHFSPCALFWEDLSSDKERVSASRFFKKRGGKERIRDELDGYMKQSHPLLGNWGKIGREMLKSLDSFLLDEKEVYEEIGGGHLLCRLKQSLLTLDESEDFIADESLQLHSATSKLREVEIMRDALETMLQSHQARGEPILPREILVLSPDISGYAPYIQMVFAKSPFAYSIEGMPLYSVSETVKGFFQLIELPQENYQLDAVLKLLRCSSFIERHDFSFDEVNQLRKWFKQAEIREALINGPNSWEQGLDRLLYGLAMTPNDACGLGVWPVGCIPHSEIDLFSKFLELFSCLKEDLSCLTTYQSAQEWVELFLRIADKYFVIEWEREPFFQELKSLALSCGHLKEKLWSFESISRILQHLSQMPKGKISSSRLDKISFVPLSQGNVRVASLIWCLGMDEASFPRNDVHSSLCEMRRFKKDYIPLKMDEDRSLFLEMLTKAENYLIFSYQRIHAEDGKNQGPSLLIDELDQYLVKRGSASGIVKIDHPAFPFDSSYFSSDSKVKKWSEEDYLASKAHYFPHMHPLPFFTSKASVELSAEEIVIDIRQLKKLARNPLQFYFNETLKIYLKDAEDEEETEFLISPLQKSMLRKKALSSSIGQILQKSGAQGKLPRGLFQEAAANEMEEEMQDLLSELKGFGVHPDEIFSVRLSTSSKEEELIITLSDSRRVHIVGELEDLTPKGLLAHIQGDLKSLVRVWPLYLIYRCLKGENRLLLLTKKGKEVEIAIEDPHLALASYIEYFLLSKQQPSPLMPEWAKALLEGSEEDLSAAMSKETKDVYTNYLKRRHGLFDPKEAFSLWSLSLKRTFSPLLRGNDVL